MFFSNHRDSAKFFVLYDINIALKSSECYIHWIVHSTSAYLANYRACISKFRKNNLVKAKKFEVSVNKIFSFLQADSLQKSCKTTISNLQSRLIYYFMYKHVISLNTQQHKSFLQLLVYVRMCHIYTLYSSRTDHIIPRRADVGSW